jgi:hypothetical protein
VTESGITISPVSPEQEANKDSPFYNENKRKKKAKIDDSNECNESNESNETNVSSKTNVFTNAFTPNKDIELDF